MGYYSQNDLEKLGIKKLGKNIKISTKASLCNPEELEIGNNSRIDDFCIISGKVTIGNNVQISVMCNLAGGEPGIVMEDFSTLAYNVHILTQSDDYSGATLTNPTIPDQYKKEIKKPIFIRKHVIIGTSSIIFPGVDLAEGCAVGAMSLVMESPEPWKILVGIPAKAIKDRKKDLLKLEELYLQESQKLVV